MADFERAFLKMSDNEGGYANNPSDPGGETYRGIARKRNPKWSGWSIIDSKKWDGFDKAMTSSKNWSVFDKILKPIEELQKRVKQFYLDNYWKPVRGDEIVSQDVADTIFDFGVNAGVQTSITLAQLACKAKTDGDMGPKSIAKINSMDPRVFTSFFILNKIARYIHICKKRPESKKFFFNWIDRTIEEA